MQSTFPAPFGRFLSQLSCCFFVQILHCDKDVAPGFSHLLNCSLRGFLHIWFVLILALPVHLLADFPFDLSVASFYFIFSPIAILFFGAFRWRDEKLYLGFILVYTHFNIFHIWPSEACFLSFFSF